MNPQKWNKYAYTINNPLRYFDPDGMEEIEIQVRSFIQQKVVHDPLLRPFAGDNRTFSTAANASSRTTITVKIETDASKRPGDPIISQTSSAGTSRQLDSNGNVVKTGTASTGLPTATGGRDANGNVVLNIQQNTKDPLEPQALTPGASVNLNVFVPQNGSAIAVTGTTSGFPAVELNVTPDGGSTTNVPLADPGLVGSTLGPMALFLPNSVSTLVPLSAPPPPPCASGKEKCQ